MAKLCLVFLFTLTAAVHANTPLCLFKTCTNDSEEISGFQQKVPNFYNHGANVAWAGCTGTHTAVQPTARGVCAHGQGYFWLASGCRKHCNEYTTKEWNQPGYSVTGDQSSQGVHGEVFKI